MDALSFFGGVWVSIAIGVFCIAMVIGCSLDRNAVESPKWWIFTIGLIVCMVYFGKHRENFEWTTFDFWEPFLKMIGLYLLIGLGYSVVEFMIEVRRAKTFWSSRWELFKKTSKREFEQAYVAAARKQSGKRIEEFDASTLTPPVQAPSEVMKEFVSAHWNSGTIIGISLEDDKLEPKLRKSALAEHVSVWTIFWPFYLVSLIIGDLLVEVFSLIATIITGLSGRFVKLAFRNVFKF